MVSAKETMQSRDPGATKEADLMNRSRDSPAECRRPAQRGGGGGGGGGVGVRVCGSACMTCSPEGVDPHVNRTIFNIVPSNLGCISGKVH